MAMPAPPVWTEGALILRPAGPADQAAIAALLQDMARHYWPDQADRAGADAAQAARALLHGQSGCAVALAEQGGEAAGMATYTLLHAAPVPEGTLFLKDLYVSPRFRGDGIGEAFMAWLTRFAAALGCVRFDWTAENDNPRALAFYDRIGATRVVEKVYYRINPQEAVS